MRTSVIALVALGVVGAGAYVLTGTDAGRGVLSSVTGGASGAAAQDGPPRRPAQRAAPAQSPVEVAEVRKETARKELASIGTLTSDESVTISTEISGRIADIRFQEGTPVAQGDVLIQLDDALAQAALESARAAYELAEVRLDKMAIRAPFAGVVGLRQSSVGAYVQPGAAIVNLEKIDTLKLDFRLPEINLADVATGMTVEVVVDALPGRTFEGQVYAIDPLLDVNGRAVRVRARLANEEGLLRPGLFARVNLIGDAREDVIVAPEASIVPRAGENFVFRIVDGKAEESKVVLGARRRGEVEVTSGLNEGDVVVVAGQTRLRAGATVAVVARGPTS